MRWLLKPVLTLIWVGFVRFEVAGVGVKIKYTFERQGPLHFADVSFFCLFFFLQKNQRFLAKIVPLLKAIFSSCVRGFLVLFSVFCKIKVTSIENISFTD